MGNKPGPIRVPLRPQAAGDQHWASAAPQDRLHFALIEGVAEFDLLVIDLGAEILS
jgi:hypothetical protein